MDLAVYAQIFLFLFFFFFFFFYHSIKQTNSNLVHASIQQYGIHNIIIIQQTSWVCDNVK